MITVPPALLLLLWLRPCAAVCPNFCSGRGVCNADTTCTCYAGFRGADCSERSCSVPSKYSKETRLWRDLSGTRYRLRRPCSRGLLGHPRIHLLRATRNARNPWRKVRKYIGLHNTHAYRSVCEDHVDSEGHFSNYDRLLHQSDHHLLLAAPAILR